MSGNFITLTYADPPMSPNGFMTLHTPHFQAFMKRLRKAHPPGVKIRYYAVGEYGTTRERPHFHAILFGHDPNLVEAAWRNPCFPQAGIVSVDELNEATVAYVCKYLHKGKSVPKHANDDRKPEFSLMSKDWVRVI